MKEKILDHLKEVDKIAYDILSKYYVSLDNIKYTPEQYFHRLCTDIVGQQLSNKAADSLIKRFETIFPKLPSTPEMINQMPEQALRDVGMAWSKVRAIKELANKTINGEITFSSFPSMNNEDIVKQLIQVKGIGTWTTEMFLIFTLAREDVFSNKDLGLKKAICKHYNLDIKNKNIEKELLLVSEKWKPYRTYMTLALWKSIDNPRDL